LVKRIIRLLEMNCCANTLANEGCNGGLSSIIHEMCLDQSRHLLFADGMEVVEPNQNKPVIFNLGWFGSLFH